MWKCNTEGRTTEPSPKGGGGAGGQNVRYKWLDSPPKGEASKAGG